MVLDSELMVTDEAGKTDFQALQNLLRAPSGKHPAYVAFDLLAFEGDDVRDRPLAERKELLKSLMGDAPDDLRYSVHVRDNSADSFRAACEQHFEDAVGKQADSPYRGVRNGDWIKLRCGSEQELVVEGYTQSAKRVLGRARLVAGSSGDHAGEVRRVDRGRSVATPQLPGHPHRQRPAQHAAGIRIGA